MIVDGAHNAPGAGSLASALKDYLPGRPLVLVLGLLADKNTSSFLSHLLPPALPMVAAVVACRPLSERALEPEALARLIQAGDPHLPVEVVPDVGVALQRAVVLAGSDGAVCVAGSLYQVGEARKAAIRVVAKKDRLSGRRTLQERGCGLCPEAEPGETD